MPTTYANGIQIAYEINGTGTPLLLIAGLGYNRRMWQQMVPELADHFQVITFDNRGVGGTDKPTGVYSADMLAADTVGLLDGLGIEKAAIMGHSMGGFVTQALALNYPQRLSHLILSATNFGGPRHIPISPEALNVLLDITGDPIARLRRGIRVSTAPGFMERHPEVVEAWLEQRRQNPLEMGPYQSQMAIGMGLLSEESCFEHRLSVIDVPTLILFGEHDRVVPTGNAQLLASKIRQSEIVTLPGAGHFFPYEVPAQANAAIIHFLQTS